MIPTESRIIHQERILIIFQIEGTKLAAEMGNKKILAW